MKTVILKKYGDPSVLELVDLPKPQPKAHEVLIKVYAAGLNRADIAQRKGHYPAPEGTPQHILGLEVSGTVAATGTQVQQWQPGDKVCALLPGGGYSGYVCADAGSCLPIPENYSLTDAASLPEALFTVWYNLFQRGRLQKNENVLIYGGSGGVGAMAIQLAHLYGAKVFSLASSAEKINYCQSLGAHTVINYSNQDIVECLGENAIHLILDSVGGGYSGANIKLLKPEGRLVYINAMEGGFPQFNIFKIMQKRLWITGSTLRSRDYRFKAALAENIRQKAFPLIQNAAFKNMVTRHFPIEKAAAAHQLMESRDFCGKIILTF